MSRKVSTLTLRYPVLTTRNVPVNAPDHEKYDYLVLKVTDSVEYHPGQRLHHNEVKRLCDNDHWKVTVGS